MIRDIKAEDRDQYIDIIKCFVDERMGEFGIYFDEAEAISQFNTFVNLPEIVCLVAVEDDKIIGTIAGVIGPMLFCKGYSLQEMVWYVKPEHRSLSVGLRLIKEFEKRAIDNGCSSLIMVGMAGDQANKYYVKDRYKLLQNSYYKGF